MRNWMSSTFSASANILVTDNYVYVMREADHQALRLILLGKFLHVIAPNKVGKTMLLTNLERRLKEEHWRCCYLDLATLESFRESETIWYTELGRELGKELTPNHIPEINNNV